MSVKKCNSSNAMNIALKSGACLTLLDIGWSVHKESCRVLACEMYAGPTMHQELTSSWAPGEKEPTSLGQSPCVFCGKAVYSHASCYIHCQSIQKYQRVSAMQSPNCEENQTWVKEKDRELISRKYEGISTMQQQKIFQTAQLENGLRINRYFPKMWPIST